MALSEQTDVVVLMIMAYLPPLDLAMLEVAMPAPANHNLWHEVYQRHWSWLMPGKPSARTWKDWCLEIEAKSARSASVAGHMLLVGGVLERPIPTNNVMALADDASRVDQTLTDTGLAAADGGSAGAVASAGASLGPSTGAGAGASTGADAGVDAGAGAGASASAGAARSAAPPARLPKGKEVVVAGTRRDDVNGRIGIVRKYFLNSGRYSVQMTDGDCEIFSLNPGRSSCATYARARTHTSQDQSGH